MVERQKVAIFGGGGFIGSNLGHRLSEAGYACTLLDLVDNKLKLRFGNAPYRFDRCDISADDDAIGGVVADHDTVIHLAAHVHPSAFLHVPLEVVQLNLFDALKIVDACVRHGRRLIHFSTCEVYGKARGSAEPFNEDRSDCVLGPIGSHRWIYSCAKQLLDRIVHAHGLKGDLDYTIVRPFNFVGPLMDRLVRPTETDNPRVFAHFMSALLFRRPMQLVDGGHSRRCFTYIDDGTAAIQRILEEPAATRNQIVNIGNPANETTIRDLAHSMRAIYRREFEPAADVPIVDVDSRTFYGDGYEDCDRRVPDIGKLRALGWAPRYDLERTLVSSMRYFVTHRDALLATL